MVKLLRLFSSVARKKYNSSVAPINVLVIGGGAAGLTSAFFAAKEGANVTVLERTSECGKKILMSGGSRCNVIPYSMSDDLNDFYTSSSRKTMQTIFNSWSLKDMQEWLADPHDGIGLPLSVEVESNKMFPTSNSSREVRDRLVLACENLGVTFQYRSSLMGVSLSTASDPGTARYSCQIGISSADSPKGWNIQPDALTTILTDRLIICSGGLSFPAVGTDGAGQRILKRDLNHSLHQLSPALVPLTGPHPGMLDGLENLAGVSLQNTRVRVVEAADSQHELHRSIRGGFLFSHKGFTGPSILDGSQHTTRLLKDGKIVASPSQELPRVLVSWTESDVVEWELILKRPGNEKVVNRISHSGIPNRLAAALCHEARLSPDLKVCDLTAENRRSLLGMLVDYHLKVTGSMGYKMAEVTSGGIPLDEISPLTLESTLHPGLYLAGEVLDVYGRIGGFNFAWAWLTGRLAGINAAKNDFMHCSN